LTPSPTEAMLPAGQGSTPRRRQNDDMSHNGAQPKEAPGHGSTADPSVAADLGADAKEMLLASISDGLVAFDNDWRFTYVNAAAERLWKRKAEELVGRTIFDALKVDPDNPFYAAYVASKATGDPAFFVAYSTTFSAWHEVRGYPHIRGYTIFIRDVTEERTGYLATVEQQRSLDVARAINQRIFETSQDLILVVDRQGRFLRVSPSSMTVLGIPPEDMVGHSAAAFVFPEDLEGTREEMRLARRGRLMRHFDCRYMHKNGRPVSIAWMGVWSEAEQQHFFIGRDMTERLEAEERLRHAQRLESVGQLTGGIAHDFNNLLAIIMGSIELMFDVPGLPPEAAERGRAALHAAQRGAELTRRLLAFARQQPLKPQVVDANELVGNLTGLLSRTLGQEIDVSFTGASDLWPVFIDAAGLESAITNLAVNARDAMPSGGRLVIETRNEILDADYARENPGAVAGEYAAVIVSDTGTGMPQEVLSRIFEPFFTTKEAGKGTGLGLSMVFGFVKQSGGHVRAYSEVGHGTSVRLYLPRAKNVAEAAPAVAPRAAAVEARKNERILVVEDNDAIRQLVLIQLTRLGYQTLEASSAGEALEILDRGDSVDLLFTDIVMPGGMSGHALAQEALKRRPGLRVLFTSGFPGALLQEIEGMSGPDAVLTKPYRTQELARRIRVLLDR
jgi:PAS domain S-box-containing protein